MRHQLYNEALPKITLENPLSYRARGLEIRSLDRRGAEQLEDVSSTSRGRRQSPGA